MVEINRRGFIKGSLGAAAVGVAPVTAAEENPFFKMDFTRFRQQLRAFYPDHCRRPCKDPSQRASVKKIGEELDAWVRENPAFDALDVRREEYMAVRRHFKPFLFTESPFYFEAGVNGGWTHSAETVPGRHVNRICSRFYRELNLIPGEAFHLLGERHRVNLTLCCGPFVDDMHHIPPFRTVLKKGFGGVRAEVAAALAKCPATDKAGRKQLETALAGLDTLKEMQLKFKAEAERILAERTDLSAAEKKNLTRIAESAARCPWEPPKTYFEGLNTLWFIRESLGYLDGTNQFSIGRPDAWLIGLYRADLAAGRITVEEARELTAKFLLTAELHHDGRSTLDGYDDQEAEIPMSLGGCYDDGTWVWNELTEMFFDAHIGCRCVFPKMHCRISAKADEGYLRKIAKHLMSGHAVYTLLNDDRHIPQYVADGYTLEDSRAYVGVGCWDGLIDSVQDVDAANYLSMMKVLEMTIYRDPELERKLKLNFKPIDDAKDFGELRDILFRNISGFMRSITGEYTRWGRANAKVFPHPTYSVCLKGGIESRRDTTDAGIPGRPRIITLGFIGNVVDSLCSINQVCFVDKKCSVKEFLDAVRSNWAGPRGEELRAAAMAAPYWGDGSKTSTGELAWWMRELHDCMEGIPTDQNGKYKFGIFTYREFMYWGANMRATPDGRRNGDRLAQGFSPSEYRCKSGITTVMNAIGELPHECLYASNVNLTFDKTAMNEDAWVAVLRVFCKKGSHMIQPNCNSVEELLDAQKHPERHKDLVVRVCGFSARFTSLSKRWQDEVISRHRLR